MSIRNIFRLLKHCEKLTAVAILSWAYRVSASVSFLSPIHTADADETKLSSLVASAVCTRIRN